jgi:hypothetical protein
MKDSGSSMSAWLPSAAKDYYSGVAHLAACWIRHTLPQTHGSESTPVIRLGTLSPAEWC